MSASHRHRAPRRPQHSSDHTDAVDRLPPTDVSRRMFLEASGYALFLSALAGCSRAPTKNAVALVEQPEGMLTGKARYYAAVCGGCSAGCGTLVKCRDGRPIKLEGNPDHPLSRGGLCAVGQAHLLGLYDSQRLQEPLLDKQPASWKEIDGLVAARLKEAKGGAGAVRLLTGTVLSPTSRAWGKKFLDQTPGAQHVIYDPLSSAAIRLAHRATHAAPLLPRYRLDRAEVIVSLDADFLGTWISPVEYTVAYRAGRAPQGQPSQMSYHVQFESRLSLSGSNADRRFVVLPGELGAVASQLVARLSRRAGKAPPDAPDAVALISAAELDQLAERLWQAHGKSIVLCGSQDLPTQVLCNHLNHLLDNYGRTLDLELPSLQQQGDEGQLDSLLADLRQKKVALLVIAGVNPVYDLPAGDDWEAALRQTPLVVYVGSHRDETAAVAKVVAAASHPLESWGDAEPVAGVAAVSQPALRPLGNTRSLLECLAAWSGGAPDGYALVRQHWQESLYPRRTREAPFHVFWDAALHDGHVPLETTAATVKPFAETALQPISVPHSAADKFTLVLYPKVSMLDGRHALNPWLQELPDPVTKVTWDNYACLSPTAANILNVKEGDVIRLTTGADQNLELPVLIQLGQHDRVVAVALGYGRQGTERFAEIGPRWIEGRPSVGANGRVGVNAASLLGRAAQFHYERGDVAITATGRKHRLACTQQHHEVRVPPELATPGTLYRYMTQHTTLAAYRQDPAAGAHAAHEESGALWPEDHPYRSERWGMVIDLSKCTGCSACVIACQAENNVPVVGKDEVSRSREMHWLRIDRYYDPQPGRLDVLFQPMLCHHCGNAPCETVCPVLATVHSSDGLNQQAYNRCVGTRYCANNCPYKVRRFNWFAYAHDDKLQNVVLNPDITVRSRGVMEKCSFCVQRIHEARQEAQRQGQPLADGAVRPACQQSCPAAAIIFGDLNNPQSAAAQAVAQQRSYRVLEELNIRPVVSYLRQVRNREATQGETHHG